MKFVKVYSDVSLIDHGIKNKWRWEWLKEVDWEGRPFEGWLKKTDSKGLCWCIVCNKSLDYNQNGKRAIHKHSCDTSHRNGMSAFKLTQTLPGVEAVNAPDSQLDRQEDLKAVTCAFISEHCLPFSLAPHLVDYAKRMARDGRSLQKLSFSRVACMYTTTHGVAKTMKEGLSSKLKETHFSISLDESTNNGNDKICNVLVRYYDDKQNIVLTEHLGALCENIATAANTFVGLEELLAENGLPLNNIVSCLMDNCNTMRGAKGGVEVLLRKEQSDLLDIHGDTVHIVSNSVKELFKPLGGHVENLASHLYYDIQHWPKSKEMFLEIQELLKMKGPCSFIRPISSRFLQMEEVTNRIHHLLDPLVVYYYSFLTSQEAKDQKPKVDAILAKHGVTNEEKIRVAEMQAHMAKQAKSYVNHERKDAIIVALFNNMEKTKVLLNLYRGIIPKFQEFVKLFQCEQPVMHLLHSQMFKLLKEILSLFIKAEEIDTQNVHKLLQLDCKQKELQVSDKCLAVGEFALPLLKEAKKNKGNEHWVNELYSNLRSGYQLAGAFLLKNLPMKNKTLSNLAALDPVMYSQSVVEMAFDQLGASLPNVVKKEECGKLQMEVKQYMVDSDIGYMYKAYSELEEKRIDRDWWAKVFHLKKDNSASSILRYPVMGKLVRALLSVFSGPLIEGTFNIMDDIVEKDRTRLTTENYAALSHIKYSLRAKGISSVEIPVTATLRRNCTSAYKNYNEFKAKKKDKHSLKRQQKLDAATELLKKEKLKKQKDKDRSNLEKASVVKDRAHHKADVTKSKEKGGDIAKSNRKDTVHQTAHIATKGSSDVTKSNGKDSVLKDTDIAKSNRKDNEHQKAHIATNGKSAGSSVVTESNQKADVKRKACFTLDMWLTKADNKTESKNSDCSPPKTKFKRVVRPVED